MLFLMVSIFIFSKILYNQTRTNIYIYIIMNEKLNNVIESNSKRLYNSIEIERDRTIINYII